MNIITREQWGARYAAGFGAAPTATEVWLHHSAGLHPDAAFTDLNRDSLDDDEATAMRRLEQIGQDRFGNDKGGGISYTFVVMPSGRVYEGTGPGRKGAHTGGRNSIARGICWAGNYEQRAPTDLQITATGSLLRHGKGRLGFWHQARLNGGHRDAPGANTACPGRWAHAVIPAINRRADEPEDDMTPEQDRMLRAVHDFLGAAGGIGTDTTQTVGWMVRDTQTALTRDLPIIKAALAVNRGDVDEAELARALADAIPADLADRVIDALHARTTPKGT